MGFLVDSGRNNFLLLLLCFSARTISQDLKLEKQLTSLWATEAVMYEGYALKWEHRTQNQSLAARMPEPSRDFRFQRAR